MRYALSICSIKYCERVYGEIVLFLVYAFICH